MANKVKFAKRFGIKQAVGLAAVLLLLLNLVLFSFHKISNTVFWIALLVIWGLGYLAVKVLKDK